MRGNRRTKNTFVAVESRSLTESDGWRVRAANPRFLPTTRDRPELAASSTSPPAAPLREPSAPPPSDAGVRIREWWWGTASGVTLPCRRHRRRRRRHRNASRRPPVILPRIVKHAWSYGQVRKLQRKHHREPPSSGSIPRHSESKGRPRPEAEEMERVARPPGFWENARIYEAVARVSARLMTPDRRSCRGWKKRSKT
ncbi:hypothetical protein ALC57_03459 [Trachymyrmex cornetzi]|uniref:Uncharacterized protein n=1 Tax=Trachymyrmex cornetzi TaxID=471704 RepID=A0A195EG23_9HYME|nr:hypothetical protein ALC57_03459 [Trachymyrmex cornetzi]